MKHIYTMLCLAGMASISLPAIADNELCDPDLCGLSYAQQRALERSVANRPAKAATPSSGALNPFAYNLSSTLSDDNKLTVNYHLNAAASGVTLKIMQGATVVKSVTLSGKAVGANTAQIDLGDLAIGDYTWSLDVTGAALTAPKYYSTTRGFYHPQTVETVRNPNDPMFGTVIVAESKIASGTGYNSNHWSYGHGGQGLYLFDPVLTAIPNTAAGSNIYAFNNWANADSWDITKSTSLWGGKTTGCNPRKVRVADDGRVYIATANIYTPPILSVASVSALAQNAAWTQWTGGGKKDYNTSAGGYWGVNSDGSGDFVAGCTAGISVVGSGDNLKLYVASGEGRMFAAANQKGARFHVYPIGSDNTWGNRVPTQISGFYSSATDGKFLVNNQYANIEVDPKGGVWMKQYRGAPTSTLPTLVCVNNGTIVYQDVTTASPGTGMRFSPDGTRLAMATSGTVITIYNVTFADNGTPTLTEAYGITHGMGNYVNDIAWDLAGNIYAVSNTKEVLKVFAIPRSNNTVNIPARADYAFTIEADDPIEPNPDSFVTVESVGVGKANPMAYDLYGEVNDNTLTVEYKLNATAKNVKINVCPASDYASDKAKVAPAVKKVALGDGEVTQGVHRLNLDISDLTDGYYIWSVEVEGDDREENPIQTFGNLKFNHPQGVDIVKDPCSPYYGYLLVTEGIGSTNSQFHSSVNAEGSGEGIYVITPNLEGVRNKVTGRYGFTGGLSTTRSVNSGYNGAVARKIRISDDGRIFLSSQTAANCPILEVPDVYTLVETDAEFTPLLAGSFDATHQAWYNNGEYRGCPNIGMDVRGSGESLQIVTFGGADGYFGSYGHSQAHFNLYNLGTFAQFDQIPATIPALEGKFARTPDSGNMTFDNRGGVWFVQYRSAVDEDTPAIKYVAADGTIKYTDAVSNDIRGAGFRFNQDFTQVAMPKSTGVFSIYDVTYAEDDTPTLTERFRVTAGMGTNFNDFVWDAANNLYAVGNNGEVIKAFSIPRAAADSESAPSTITTSIAPLYTFAISGGTTTGVQQPQVAEPKHWNAYSIPGHIVITGAASDIEVFTIHGQLISRGKRDIPAAKGVYVVRVDGTATKVMVK